MYWDEELQNHLKTLPAELKAYAESVWHEINIVNQYLNSLKETAQHTDMELLACLLKASPDSLKYFLGEQLDFLVPHYKRIIGHEKEDELQYRQSEMEKEQGLIRKNDNYRKIKNNIKTIRFKAYREAFEQACNNDPTLIDAYIDQLNAIRKGQKRGKIESWSIFSQAIRKLYEVFYPLYTYSSRNMIYPQKLLEIVANIISAEVQVIITATKVKSCIQDTCNKNSKFLPSVQRQAESIYSRIKKQPIKKPLRKPQPPKPDMRKTDKKLSKMQSRSINLKRNQ